MPPKPADWLRTKPPKFPVYVHVPAGCQPVAVWALRQEGLEVVTKLEDGELSYGNFLADAWQRGEGFINVEHDKAPWWGALRELWECPQEWCVFPYPQGMGHPDPSLGCTKFGRALVCRYPMLHHDFRNVPWNRVEERVNPYLWDRGHCWHEHWPPIAHARQREG